MLRVYNLGDYTLKPAGSLNKEESGVEWRRENGWATLGHPNGLRTLIWTVHLLYFIFTNKESESQQDQVTGQDHICQATGTSAQVCSPESYLIR